MVDDFHFNLLFRLERKHQRKEIDFPNPYDGKAGRSVFVQFTISSITTATATSGKTTFFMSF